MSVMGSESNPAEFLQPDGAAGHPNALLVRRLYTALARNDASAAAECYADDARFEDIAFRLQGKPAIALMWQVVCRKLEEVATGEVLAGSHIGVGIWIPRYPRLLGRGPSVVNPTTSLFRFHEGAIIEQTDLCDAAAWAAQAFTFPVSAAMARLAPARRLLARRTMRKHRRAGDG
jgi:hypothetical protein